MNRRHLFAAIPSLALATTSFGQKPGASPAALAKSAANCIEAGEICLAHCHDMLANSPAMAACAKTVSEVLAICTALERLAAQNAPTLAKQAAIALDACKRCDAQCRKFAAMPQCKACADACVACAAECAKFA